MKFNFYSFILFLSFTILSCTADTTTIVQKDKDDRVLEKISIDTKTKKKQGLYQRFYPSGNLAEEAFYDRDSLNGTRKFYYESGSLEQEQNYLSGIFQGPFRSFYINGKTNVEGNYVNNEMDGVWKRYYDTGELKEEVNFVNNDENGPFKEYFKNGKLKTEGTYVNGPNEQGELKEYNEEGELIKIMSCNSGICNTIWVK